ncbi:MAG: alpha/beta fold hydrolase [Alphaproteobacteria bacterium]
MRLSGLGPALALVLYLNAGFASAKNATVTDLPLVEIPAATTPGRAVVLFLSGDGGWADLDRDVGKLLAEKGLPVIGVDCLKYFWRRRTPGETAVDMERALRHYLGAWRKDRVVLIGYSFGASILPFIVTRLPGDLRQRIDAVVLLGANWFANTEVHIRDWFRDRPDPFALNVAPEAARLEGTPVLCLYGSEESELSLCPRLPPGRAEIVRTSGGHHFNGDYPALAATIQAFIDRHGRP